MKRLLIINLFILFFLNGRHVDASWLEQNWNSMISGSATAPDMVQQQGSGAYYGGGFTYGTGGTAISRIVPVDVQVPSISAGCGGISITNGAFDYNVEELINFLKSLISNAPGYAFQLAMQVLCPSCLDILNTLNQISGMINGMQMDSCAVLQGLTDWASDKATKAISDSSIGGGFSSYRTAMEGFNNNMKTGLNNFFDKVRKGLNCATDPKKCKSIDFLEGNKSFMETLFEFMRANETDTSLKKYFEDDYEDLFRGLIGDMKYIKVGSSTEADKDRYNQSLIVINPIYGSTGSKQEVLNKLISGSSDPIPDKGINAKYTKTVDLEGQTWGNNGNNWKTGYTFDTFNSIAFNVIDNAKNKYKLLDRGETLTAEELSFFSTLKTPVLRTLNVIFIDDRLPKSFLDELKPLAGVQLEYEIINIVAKNLYALVNQYKEELEKTGLGKEEINRNIAYITRNLAEIQQLSYKLYVKTYTDFDKRIKTVSEEGVFNQMYNMRATYLARHPVAGAAVFAGGIGK